MRLVLRVRANRMRTRAPNRETNHTVNVQKMRRALALFAFLLLLAAPFVLRWPEGRRRRGPGTGTGWRAVRKVRLVVLVHTNTPAASAGFAVGFRVRRRCRHQRCVVRIVLHTRKACTAHGQISEIAVEIAIRKASDTRLASRSGRCSRAGFDRRRR